MTEPKVSFFSLPRELRNQVYGYLITDVYQPLGFLRSTSERVSDAARVWTRTVRWNTHPPFSKTLNTAVELVNKQFAEEAKEEFFRRHTFMIGTIDRDVFRQCASLMELPVEYRRTFSRVKKLQLIALYLHPILRFNSPEPWTWSKFYERAEEIVQACKCLKRVNIIVAGTPEDRSAVRCASAKYVVSKYGEWSLSKPSESGTQEEANGLGP